MAHEAAGFGIGLAAKAVDVFLITMVKCSQVARDVAPLFEENFVAFVDFAEVA